MKQPPLADTLPLQDVYILPGEVRVANVPTRFLTILGSCVAVCLYDNVHGVGGINHFLLPGAPAPGDPDPLRWSGPAIAALRERALAAGASAPCLQAKVFGGSTISTQQVPESLRVGDRNVAAAMQELQKLRIPIEIRDTGGHAGRKLLFESHSGQAWVKKLQHAR